MGVFTLYNCGTDYHRGSNDIVAQLWRETTSDCEINDGIGSPGENNGGALTATGATLHDDWRNNIPKVGPLMGSAFGVDIDNNVAAGLNVIKRRLKKDPQLQLNMLGWSRGAVTCYKIANHMHFDTEDGLDAIPVRIFAVDPVPGGTDFNNHVRENIRLTRNVKEARVILAQHERRWLFRPVLPQGKGYKPDSVGGILDWDTMPGNHSSIVEEKQGLRPAYRLVRHLAKEFLMDQDLQGTRFANDDDILMPLEILEQYTRIYRKWDLFKATGNKQKNFASFFTRRRTVQSQNGQKNTLMVLKPRRGLSGDDFFINKHHRDVFRSRYEALYLEMQQYRPFAYYSRRPAWKNAMERLERELPKTFEDLCGHFADVEGSIL